MWKIYLLLAIAALITAVEFILLVASRKFEEEEQYGISDEN